MEQDMVEAEQIASAPNLYTWYKAIHHLNIISGKLDHSDGLLLLKMEAFVAVDQLYQLRLEIKKESRTSTFNLQLFISSADPPIMEIE